MADKFVRVRDNNDIPINPAESEDISDLKETMVDLLNLMKRMNKLLESNAVVDSLYRQRVVVDTGVSVNSGYSIGSSTTTNSLNGNPYTLAAQYMQMITEGPVDQRWRIIDAARTSFATGIRSKLG